MSQQKAGRCASARAYVEKNDGETELLGEGHEKTSGKRAVTPPLHDHGIAMDTHALRRLRTPVDQVYGVRTA